MKFEEKLKKKRSEEIWNEYCGFLDLNISEYMGMQKRLMEEQLFLWGNSELGKRLLKGRRIHSIEELRESFPLTTYEDYADVLLQNRAACCPAIRSFGYRPPGKGENTRLRLPLTPRACSTHIKIMYWHA